MLASSLKNLADQELPEEEEEREDASRQLRRFVAQERRGMKRELAINVQSKLVEIDLVFGSFESELEVGSGWKKRESQVR